MPLPQITRDQLFRALNGETAVVRAIEYLLKGLQDAPEEIPGAQAAADTAIALGLHNRFAPDLIAPRQWVVDYLDFDLAAPRTSQVGRMGWNATDETLDLVLPGGVTQQLGLEVFIRVVNTSGVLIPNGSVVGFGGVSGGTVIGVPYIANGTMPMGYVGGIATQDIAPGSVGRVTVLGFVRGINTVAHPVGSTLYASPTVAGAFTATKPTAPNFAIPLGVVTASSAGAGEVFVRPILEQTKHYGTFLKTTDQTPAAANTAYAITFDSTEVALGFSIGAPTSRIVAAEAGLYTFGASFQLVSGSASVKNVWLWFRKNGVDVANSALKVSLESATAVNTQYRSRFFSLVAGDYIELMLASDSTNVTLDAIAATGFAPAAPACVLTVDQIQQ